MMVRISFWKLDFLEHIPRQFSFSFTALSLVHNSSARIVTCEAFQSDKLFLQFCIVLFVLPVFPLYFWFNV